MVKQRFESARKELAPKISDCIPGEDQASFTYFINYGGACALVKGKPQGDGTATRVSVEVRSISLWARPLGMIIAMAILLIGTLIGSLFFHSKTLADWLLFPGSLLVWIGINLALVPLAKKFLVRFVHDTLMNDSDATA